MSEKQTALRGLLLKRAFVFLFRKVFAISGILSKYYFYLNKKNREKFPLFVGNEKFLNPIILLPMVEQIDEIYLLKSNPIVIFREPISNKYCIEIIRPGNLNISDNDEIIEEILNDFPDSSEFFLFNLDLFR